MKIVTHIGSVMAGNVSLALQVRIGPGISCRGAVACVLSMFEVMALPDWIKRFTLVENFWYLSPRSMPFVRVHSSAILLTKNREEYGNRVAQKWPTFLCDLPLKKVSHYWATRVHVYVHYYWLVGLEMLILARKWNLAVHAMSLCQVFHSGQMEAAFSSAPFPPIQIGR